MARCLFGVWLIIDFLCGSSGISAKDSSALPCDGTIDPSELHCIPGSPAFEQWIAKAAQTDAAKTARSQACVSVPDTPSSALRSFCAVENSAFAYATEAQMQILWQIGVSLFQSSDKLVQYLQMCSIHPTEIVANRPVRLMMLKTDKATETFAVKEQQDDHYGFAINSARDAAGVLLDVGGHIGVTLIAAKQRNPDIGQMISIEPTPQNYLLLRWNLAANGMSAVVALNCGIGKEPDAYTFDITWRSSDTTGSSTTAHFKRGCDMCKTDTGKAAHQAYCSKICDSPIDITSSVYAIPLNRIIDQFIVRGSSISVLKLDCEGCEAAAVTWDSTVKQKFTGVRIIGEGHPHLLEKDWECTRRAVCAIPGDSTYWFTGGSKVSACVEVPGGTTHATPCVTAR